MLINKLTRKDSEIRKLTKKAEYKCQNCGNGYLAFPSQRRGKTHTCSQKCAGALRSSTNKGAANPNYKHGIHCQPSLCYCGQEKDYRDFVCSDCTNLRKPAEGYDRTVDGILKAIQDSSSFVEASIKTGSSRVKIKNFVERNNICIDHFKVCRHRPSSEKDIFKIHPKRVNSKVRKFIIENEILDYKCSICKLDDWWEDCTLTLELDHINGDCCDNRLGNLRFLCPNCHSQTQTYRGRGIKCNPNLL